MHEQPENFGKRGMENGAKENSALMPLGNERDEVEIQMHVREAKDDQDALQKLMHESEEIIKRGRSVSSINARDKEIILKHERRIALIETVLNGTYDEQLKKDAAREANRLELLAKVKETRSLDVLRELAEKHVGAFKAQPMIADMHGLDRFVAVTGSQLYEMEKNPRVDPIELLKKKYEVAYAQDLQRKRDTDRGK